MTTTPIPAQSIASVCLPLNRDYYGNPRFFIPAAAIGIEPGSQIARKVGLAKYRGKAYGPGFVIQSYNLESDLSQIIEQLDLLKADHGVSEYSGGYLDLDYWRSLDRHEPPRG